LIMMDEFLNVPAPRFALESDSSGVSEFEDEDVTQIKARRPHQTFKPPKVSVLCPIGSGSHCLAIVGQAGKLWSQGLRGSGTECGVVTVDEVQVASLVQVDSDHILLLVSDHVLRSAMNPMAEAILRALHPVSFDIIDSYQPQTYLSSRPSEREDMVLRFLQTQPIVSESPHVRLYDVPNLVTGISAALFVEANRLSLPSLLVLLPTLASAPTVQMSRRARPSGLYDPDTEDGHSLESEPSVPVLKALNQAELGALTWPQWSWDVSSLSSPTSFAGWQWLVSVERQRLKVEREKSDLDSLYL